MNIIPSSIYYTYIKIDIYSYFLLYLIPELDNIVMGIWTEE